jgi:acyl-CoA synthetase (AMP-forming)/AMP-acid ligase II
MKLSNLKQLIERQTSQHKNSPFLFSQESRETYTYEELRNKIREISVFFQELEIRKNEIICTLLHNSPEFIFIWFTAMYEGVVTVPLNPDEEISSIKFKIKDCKPKVIFIEKSLKEKFLNEIKNLAQNIILVEKNCKFFTIKRGKRKKPPFFNDVAEIMYTSGTTGGPKGCILTHTNILTDVKGISEWQKFDETTRMLCVLPLFHVSGQIISVLAVFYGGGSVVIAKKFSTKFFWQTVKNYEVNVVNVVPTILIYLLNKSTHHFQRLKPFSLSRILCGAAPLPVEVIKKFEKVFRIPIVQTYGLTEGTCVSTSNPIEPLKRRLASVGQPLPINQVIIVNERGEEQPPFKIGEVCIRGNNVFRGYLNAKSLTRSVLKNGWLHTGDLGYMDEERFLYLVGRKKEMINRGGEKISPIEIENVVHKLTEIAKVVAVGVEDKIYGEHPAIVVECKPRYKLTPQLMYKIKEHCSRLLAKFKQPQEIVSIKSLGWANIPCSPSGKFLRGLIKERLNEYLKKEKNEEE